MSTVALTLLARSALRDEIVDRLLSHEATARAGFVTRDVQGHGLSVEYHSVSEQIRGFCRQIEITVTAEETDIQSLLESLAIDFAGRGISYQLLSVSKRDEI